MPNRGKAGSTDDLDALRARLEAAADAVRARRRVDPDDSEDWAMEFVEQRLEAVEALRIAPMDDTALQREAKAELRRFAARNSRLAGKHVRLESVPESLLVSHEPGPEAETLRHSVAEQVARAVSRLSDSLHSFYKLRFEDGTSLAAIAAELGISASAAGKRAFDLRKKLIQLLIEEGMDDAEAVDCLNMLERHRPPD